MHDLLSVGVAGLGFAADARRRQMAGRGGEIDFRCDFSCISAAIAGDHAGVLEAFQHWVHAGGRVIPALAARRAREVALWDQPDGAADVTHQGAWPAVPDQPIPDSQ